METAKSDKAVIPSRMFRTPDGMSHSTLSGRTILIFIGVAVLLKVGQEIFLPFALAVLLTFMLAPVVSFLRNRSVPKVLAVIFTVTAAFCLIAFFSFIVATQVANLAENISNYQRNIVEKVHALAQAGAGNEMLERLSGVAEHIDAEIQTKASESDEGSAPQQATKEPIPVEIITPSNALQTLGNLILPLISPFATTGLIIVLVIFMLLEREELRDRFIRLVGLGDLHKTTAALQDAGQRVSRYLFMQLVVNSLYALPITVGLWMLGIPNAILWGLLTLVLRFVPYIGPVIGMILPLFLALAIAPGWSLVIWVAVLFITTELLSNNVVEPWLYGSHTGLSPLAIIISAIFWSWLWGPLGLMLSTPLTVCLVVLGRYVPQFGFLDVLLGNEPVLEPHEKLYQRLLSGDPNEATDNAEDFLEEASLIDYYDKVGLPALVLGEMDRQRGVMSESQIALFSSSTITLVENLSDIADEKSDSAAEITDAGSVNETQLSDGKGHTILCIGGRGLIDNAACAMLSQVLEVQGATVASATHSNLADRTFQPLAVNGVDTSIVAFMNGNSKSHARQIIRRLKRSKPSIRVGILTPTANGQDYAHIDPTEIDADFVVTSLTEAVRLALTDEHPRRPKADLSRAARRGARDIKPA